MSSDKSLKDNSIYESKEGWVRGAKRLPGLFTTVKWRNADGGNIPLPDATPLEHYKRAGANINWHEWYDEKAKADQQEEHWEKVINHIEDANDYNWERLKSEYTLIPKQ